MTPDVLEQAARRLSLLLGLSREQAERVLLEVFDALSFDVDAYILARHAELQTQGVTNPEIYERIAAELPLLRFKAKPISARQIRRRIYG